MTKVVRLIDRQSRETVAVLEHALEMARKGQTLGIALVVKPVNAPMDVLLTDLLRRHPAEAARGLLRLSKRINELQDELDEAQYG